MRLTELLNKDEVTISCELFPPKQGAQLENYKNIESLVFHILFLSFSYLSMHLVHMV